MKVEPELEPEPEPEPGAPELSAEAKELAALRAELRSTQEKLEVAEGKLGHWRAAARDFTHASCFGPLQCQYYKETMTDLLTESLLLVEGVEAVRWVSCSFPSVPAHAPQMELVSWRGLGTDSLWDVSWKAPWAVEVCVDGTNGWISCTAMLRLRELSLRGQLGLTFTPAMTEAIVSFPSDPSIELYVCRPTSDLLHCVVRPITRGFTRVLRSGRMYGQLGRSARRRANWRQPGAFHRGCRSSTAYAGSLSCTQLRYQRTALNWQARAYVLAGGPRSMGCTKLADYLVDRHRHHGRIPRCRRAPRRRRCGAGRKASVRAKVVAPRQWQCGERSGCY